MVMFLKRLSLTGAAVVLSTAAMAADLPAPVIEHIPEVPAAGGWYLRGDIGYKVYNEPNTTFNGNSGLLRYDREELDDAWMIGVGVGYQFTDYFRGDLTIDYETKAKYSGRGPCVCVAPGYSIENADIDVWTVMLNGYVDIGTWHNITPYVGAGIGASYVNVSGYNSVNPDGTTPSYDGSNGEWNLAWALMAGASYAVTNNWSVDAGYQYRNLGTGKSVKIHDAGNTRVEFKDITAHEFRLGARYTFDSYAAAPAPSYYPAQPITSNF
ncbi:porin family protein [Roseibium polysiphoniae]|uniref:Porin family protein n=1 Tax=Roseibium polysiphoniae TaxID=2571221 RepID=A0A944CE25_9HYPH|nr:outer membrane protein [Roseibium polysiphoniae]MBS8260944.1 porin family protein [Roseibium polysiphoniae]